MGIYAEALVPVEQTTNSLEGASRMLRKDPEIVNGVRAKTLIPVELRKKGY